MWLARRRTIGSEAEIEKRRLEEQKQQLEQAHSVQPQSNSEKPTDQGTEVIFDSLPSIQKPL